MPQYGKDAQGNIVLHDGQGWRYPTQEEYGAPDFPAFTMPPRIPSGRTDAQDAATGHELLKQLLTLGGGAVGSLLGPPGTIAGAAAGRTLGHVPEALVSRTTGQPNSGSFVRDPAIGALEGGIQEILPSAIGLGAKYGGQLLGAAGRALNSHPLARLLVGERIGNWMGGVPGSAVGGALALGGPPLAEAAGGAMERIGAAVGPHTLSQRTRPILDRLQETSNVPLTGDELDELLTRGREAYTAAKASQQAGETTAARASGLSGIREPVPDLDVQYLGDVMNAGFKRPVVEDLTGIRAEQPAPQAPISGLRTPINADVLERMYQKAGPAFRALERGGTFAGDRLNRFKLP